MELLKRGPPKRSPGWGKKNKIFHLIYRGDLGRGSKGDYGENKRGRVGFSKEKRAAGHHGGMKHGPDLLRAILSQAQSHDLAWYFSNLLCL